MEATRSSALWTGRLAFDLHGVGDHDQHGGCAVATVELSVRLDIVLCFIGNRTIAVLDRDRFRWWLVQPYEPWIVDDVVWSMIGGDIALSVDGSTPYVLGDEVAREMVRVV